MAERSLIGVFSDDGVGRTRLLEQVVEYLFSTAGTGRVGFRLTLHRYLWRKMGALVPLVFGRHTGLDLLRTLETLAAIERDTLRTRMKS